MMECAGCTNEVHEEGPIVCDECLTQLYAAPDLYTELQKARDNLAMIVREGLVLEYYDFTSMDAAIAKVERAREGME